MLVYRITNILNGKKYIGQTKMDLKQRWYKHCAPSSGCCRLLHRAIMKYGKENFKVEVVAKTFSQVALDYLEEYFMIIENSVKPFGYNLMENSSGNKIHHEDTKKKMSTSRKGRLMSGRAARGVLRGPRPPEVGRNISLAKKGRPNGLKGKKKNPGIIKPNRWQPVKAVHTETLEEKFFPSIKEAALVLDISHPLIVKVANGERPHSRGWKFERLDRDVAKRNAGYASEQKQLVG